MHIRGLKWVNNSCYIDSVLLPFVVVPPIRKALKKPTKNENSEYVRGVLINIFNYMISANTTTLNLSSKNEHDVELVQEDIRLHGCTLLRKYIREVGHGARYSGSHMNDASEFLTYLFDLLNIEGCTLKNSTYFSKNKRVWKRTSEQVIKTSPIINVMLSEAVSDGVRDTNGIPISEFLCTEVIDEIKYKDFSYKLVSSEVSNSDFLIFNVIRLNGDRFLETRVIPTQTLRKFNMSLVAVVVFQRHHYTTYISVHNEWYFYDDRAESLFLIGSYENMLTSSPSPLTNGILYYYA